MPFPLTLLFLSVGQGGTTGRALIVWGTCNANIWTAKAVASQRQVVVWPAPILEGLGAMCVAVCVVMGSIAL